MTHSRKFDVVILSGCGICSPEDLSSREWEMRAALPATVVITSPFSARDLLLPWTGEKQKSEPGPPDADSG
jgi:hypothetical protein